MEKFNSFLLSVEQQRHIIGGGGGGGFPNLGSATAKCFDGREITCKGAGQCTSTDANAQTGKDGTCKCGDNSNACTFA